MIVRDVNRNTILAAGCDTADTFRTRLAGLMGRKSLEDGCGVLITPSNSIHMFFMRFPIDVLFLDRDNVVVHIIEGIKPWRVSKIISKAYSVLELPYGSVRSSSTETGDRLEFI